MAYLDERKNGGSSDLGREVREDIDFSGNEQGDMTVREAGQRGGQRVRELVEEGEEVERRDEEAI